MGSMQKRGKSGAAKNYVSRAAALRKLQVSLADFRRLCILKGIFPRQPRHAKRAGSQHSTFYYAKDIQFLLHEPVLQHLRDHKAFAKRLSRAIGRQNYALAQSIHDLEKPVMKLDHLVRERYPTFGEAVHDMDDALSMLNLFAHLPARPGAQGGGLVNHKLVERCARLVTEWQVWCMHARALRKVFLSIKGVYLQAEVRGQPVTWLVPYLFTQNVPDDVDFRVMVTFLDLYQTVTGFVLFKLYKDANLVYPPPLDQAKDQAGAGMSAIQLTEKNAEVLQGRHNEPQQAARGTQSVTDKDVAKEIQAINQQTASAEDEDMTDATPAAPQEQQAEEEFVTHPSKADPQAAPPEGSLTTLAQLEAQRSEEEEKLNLFQPYYFYLSRETPRSLLEFVLRCFGADASHVGWDAVVGAGSALDVKDPRITHHIVDRPVPTKGVNPYDPALYPGARTFVQPQWLIDSVNARTLLPTEPYAPGKTLPPHLSPFVDNEAVRASGGYVPSEAGLEPQETVAKVEDAQDEAPSDDDEEDGSNLADMGELSDGSELSHLSELERDQKPGKDSTQTDSASNGKQSSKSAKKAGAAAANRPARTALLAAPWDENLLDQAELEAEAVGGEDEVKVLRQVHARTLRASKKAGKTEGSSSSSSAPTRPQGAKEREAAETAEAQKMAASLLSNKQRKLHASAQRRQDVQSAEAKVLADKKKRLAKQGKQTQSSGKKAAKRDE